MVGTFGVTGERCSPALASNSNLPDFTYCWTTLSPMNDTVRSKGAARQVGHHRALPIRFNERKDT